MTNETKVRRLSVDLTEAKYDEFVRLANERHDRTPGKQGRRVIEEWIATEQAAEAAEQEQAA